MFFLSAQDRETWSRLAAGAENGDVAPDDARSLVKDDLFPALCFFIGSRLSASGRVSDGREWFSAGAVSEDTGLFSNAFLLGFLERQKGTFRKPAVAFEDPRPFIHFTGVPVMKNSRTGFITTCMRTLPRFQGPVRVLDLGCGDGGLTATFVQALLASGNAPFIESVLLVDSSHAMLELAGENLRTVLPGTSVTTVNNRIQEASLAIPGHYDIAISSLAYHHMPFDDKLTNLIRLKDSFDHFILFEMDANHDTPELGSPELAFSVYQAYGRIIDFVFSHDADPEIACACVDNFLITELISILTEPRGIRSDYHMTRAQWQLLFDRAFQDEFDLQCDVSSYADEFMDLFTFHYARKTPVLSSAGP